MTPTFLGREPVAWTTAIRLGLLAAIAFGLPLTEVQLVAIIAAIEAALFLLTRTQVTPNVAVVERTEARDTTVVAGPANDRVIEGQIVRPLGTHREPDAEGGWFTTEDDGVFPTSKAIARDTASTTVTNGLRRAEHLEDPDGEDGTGEPVPVDNSHPPGLQDDPPDHSDPIDTR